MLEKKLNLSKNETQQTVKTVNKINKAYLSIGNDKELLKRANEILVLMKQINAARSQPFCPTCNESMQDINLTYEGKNFRFYYCVKDHSNSICGKSDMHSSLADFLKKLEEIHTATEERPKEEAVVEELGSLFG